MLSAITFDDVLSRAPAFGAAQDLLGQRLISIVFARPSSPVWRDLETNRAFLDARSGDAWDLFFAGLSAFAAVDEDAVAIVDPFWNGRFPRFMNPLAFAQIEQSIYLGQERAAKAGTESAETWRYSGETDLVSFMCYEREPDWASLRSIRIEEAMTGRPMSLGRITEGLAQWEADEVDPQIAPGSPSFYPGGRYATSLSKALAWSSSAVAGGVLGGAAYDLLKLLLGR